MANFIPSKKEATDFNNGVQYVGKNEALGIEGDRVQAETINNLIESALYSQEMAENPVIIQDVEVSPSRTTETGNVYDVNVTLSNGKNIFAGDFEAQKGENGKDGKSITEIYNVGDRQSGDSTVTTLRPVIGDTELPTFEIRALNGTGFNTSGSYPNVRVGEATTATNDSSGQNINNRFSNIETELSSLLKKIYPVGSIYLTLSSTETPASIIGGSWVKLPNGGALWAASSVSQNISSSSTTSSNLITAGLPNITGNLKISNSTANTGLGTEASASGALSLSDATSTKYKTFGDSQSSYNIRQYVNFDANDGAEVKGIYGNSDTVQPPAYKVYAWRRYA